MKKSHKILHKIPKFHEKWEVIVRKLQRILNILEKLRKIQCFYKNYAKIKYLTKMTYVFTQNFKKSTNFDKKRFLKSSNHEKWVGFSPFKAIFPIQCKFYMFLIQKIYVYIMLSRFQYLVAGWYVSVSQLFSR